jgi:surface protein
MAIQSASAKLYTGIRCWVVDKNISAALTSSFSLGNKNRPTSGGDTVFADVLAFKLLRAIADLVVSPSVSLTNERYKTYGGGNNVLIPGKGASQFTTSYNTFSVASPQTFDEIVGTPSPTNANFLNNLYRAPSWGLVFTSTTNPVSSTVTLTLKSRGQYISVGDTFTINATNNQIIPAPLTITINSLLDIPVVQSGGFNVTSSVVCKFPTYFRIDVDKLDLPQGTTCTVSFEEDWIRDGVYLESTKASSAAIGNFFTFRTPWKGASFINSAFTLPNTVLRIKQLASSVSSTASFTALPIFNPGKFAALFAGVSQIVPNAVKNVSAGATLFNSFGPLDVGGTPVLATILKIKQLASPLTSSLTLLADSIKFKTPGVVNISSNLTLSASVDRNIGPIISIVSSSGTMTTNAVKTARSNPAITATSSVSASSIVTLGLIQNITAVSSLSASIDVPMILKYVIPSNSGTVYLPIFYGNINCKVDWGDGSAIQTVTQRELSSGGFNLGISHSYGPGNYTVKIFGTLEKVGKPRYAALPNTNNQTNLLFDEYLREIQSFGDLGTTSFEQAFSNVLKLEKVARRIPSTVTDTSWMFWFSTAGQQQAGWNIDDCQYWNTVNVTNMEGMFFRCREGFNAPIGNWNTSNVTNMSLMFQFAANDTNGFNQNLNSWNTGNVTNMSYMFAQAKYYNQPMNNWDVSNVSNFKAMFWGENPINAFNQDIGAWDVTGCTERANMELMLYTGGSLSNLDLSQWCVPTIATEPVNFATVGGLAFNKKPVWGTCP